MNSPATVDELIEEGQALVHSLASRIYKQLPVKVEFCDLVAYGELGLAQAARDFNPEKGAQFTTFAYYRVRGAIYDGVSKMSWTSRARYRRFRYQQMANEVLSEDAKTPGDPDATLDEGATWFRDTTDKLAVVFLASQQGQPGDSSPEADFEDHSVSGPAMVAQQEVVQKLHVLIDGLPNQVALLIRSIYFEGATLERAASRLGISKSWASRLHARALDQLGASLRRLGVD